MRELYSNACERSTISHRVGRSVAGTQNGRYDAGMHWLMHGNLSNAVAHAIKRHGHEPHALDELGLAQDAEAQRVLEETERRQWGIITNNRHLISAILEKRVIFGRTIVYLQLEGADIEQDDAIDRLFERYARLALGRMYTVTEKRVKVRQLATQTRSGSRGGF